MKKVNQKGQNRFHDFTEKLTLCTEAQTGCSNNDEHSHGLRTLDN